MRISILYVLLSVLIFAAAASAVSVTHTIEGVLILDSGSDDPQLHGSTFEWTMLFETTDPPADVNDGAQFDMTEYHAISSTLTLTGSPQNGVYTDDEPGIAMVRDWPSPGATNDSVEYGSAFEIDNEPLKFLILFDLGANNVLSPAPSALPVLFRAVGPNDGISIRWSEDNDLSVYTIQRGAIAAVPEPACGLLLIFAIGLMGERGWRQMK